jgi:hypothetical protein
MFGTTIVATTDGMIDAMSLRSDLRMTAMISDAMPRTSRMLIELVESYESRGRHEPTWVCGDTHSVYRTSPYC